MKSSLMALILLFQNMAFTPRVVTWTAIGDSITYLNDHHDETGNRITNGYMAVVAAKHPNISYINQGHNGWTTAGIAKEVENLGTDQNRCLLCFSGHQ